MSEPTIDAPHQTLPRSAVGAPVRAPLIDLFEVTMPSWPQSTATAPVIYRFVASEVTGEAAGEVTGKIGSGGVTFAGHRFQAYPVQTKGFAWSADGPPVRPLLELSNMSGLFSAAVDADHIRGASVRRIITLTSELAPPDGTGGGTCFPPEDWIVDRVARRDHQLLRLELVAVASLEDRLFPPRVMLRDLCQHRYRRWDRARRAFDYDGVTCPYTGKRYFTATGEPTRSAAADQCSLRLASGCGKRFPKIKPFLGFPGITRL